MFNKDGTEHLPVHQEYDIRVRTFKFPGERFMDANIKQQHGKSTPALFTVCFVVDSFLISFDIFVYDTNCFD